MMQLTKSKFVLAARGVQLDNGVISLWLRYFIDPLTMKIARTYHWFSFIH